MSRTIRSCSSTPTGAIIVDCLHVVPLEMSLGDFTQYERIYAAAAVVAAMEDRKPDLSRLARNFSAPDGGQGPGFESVRRMFRRAKETLLARNVLVDEGEAYRLEQDASKWINPDILDTSGQAIPLIPGSVAEFARVVRKLVQARSATTQGVGQTSPITTVGVGQTSPTPRTNESYYNCRGRTNESYLGQMSPRRHIEDRASASAGAPASDPEKKKINTVFSIGSSLGEGAGRGGDEDSVDDDDRSFEAKVYEVGDAWWGAEWADWCVKQIPNRPDRTAWLHAIARCGRDRESGGWDIVSVDGFIGKRYGQYANGGTPPGGLPMPGEAPARKGERSTGRRQAEPEPEYYREFVPPSFRPYPGRAYDDCENLAEVAV